MKTETYKLGAELDSFNYQQVQDDILAILNGGASVVLYMTDCNYISSTGLRVLLYAHKVMSRKGGMKVTHVNEIVNEVFEVTGFADILTIE